MASPFLAQLLYKMILPDPMQLLILMELAMILLGNHISILYQQLYLIESLLMASLADLDPTLEPELYHYPSPV